MKMIYQPTRERTISTRVTVKVRRNVRCQGTIAPAGGGGTEEEMTNR